ncbi:hypothetical protein B7P43_G02556 [Cryptotermes secundus]|uniref:DUF4817 domain-containing protein n=1 Tax=Cryptotermes secundus TaxID=105785 RepID=A0A2J7RNH7_9NEOP|nr:hypothetical protein B7P43_G02556 [Cryptotermes secundus]
MLTPQEQVQCLLWLAELQLLTAVQRRFRKPYGRQPPVWKSFWFWDNKLRATDSLLRVKSPGKTRTSEENVNRIREAFQQSPSKSIRAAGLQLRSPRSTLYDAPQKKRIRLRAYKIQIIYALKPSDQVARVATLRRADPPSKEYRIKTVEKRPRHNKELYRQKGAETEGGRHTW